MIGNYNQLTIGQFIKCKAITSLETDPVQRKVKMLAAISGKSEDEIESMPIQELIGQLKDLTQVETLKPTDKVKMKFRIGKRRFECIWKSQELLAAQYFDVTHFCEKDIPSNLHNILAAICVERTWYGKRLKYDGNKHKEVADLFYNEMKVSTAYPIMLFFCKYLEELEKNTLTFSAQKVEELIRLFKSGDGLQL